MPALKPAAPPAPPTMRELADARIAAGEAFVAALDRTEEALVALNDAERAFFSGDPENATALAGAQRQLANAMPYLLVGHMEFHAPRLFRLMGLQPGTAMARGRLDAALARTVANDLNT